MNNEYVIRIPSYVYLPRKKSSDKRFNLNLNTYRNAHFQILNQAKKQFSKDIAGEICCLPYFKNPITINYSVFLARKNGDVMNVGSVVDKFFCDSLQNFGKIRDDNCKFVVSCTFEFGGIEKNGGYVIARINEDR